MCHKSNLHGLNEEFVLKDKSAPDTEHELEAHPNYPNYRQNSRPLGKLYLKLSTQDSSLKMTVSKVKMTFAIVFWLESYIHMGVGNLLGCIESHDYVSNGNRKLYVHSIAAISDIKSKLMSRHIPWDPSMQSICPHKCRDLFSVTRSVHIYTSLRQYAQPRYKTQKIELALFPEWHSNLKRRDWRPQEEERQKIFTL